MRPLLRTLLLLPAALLAAGCVATQQDMLQMQSQMDDLNTNLSNMQKNQAELAVKMDELSRNLNASSENMKDISSQMTSLSDQLSALGTSVDKHVSAISQSIRKQEEQVQTSLLPAKIYNDAYNAYLNNNFDGAVTGFKTYLSRFPQGETAEGAYFYLGESLYLKGAWQESALAYANMLEKYPGSPRVPAARLKYALALLRMPGNKKVEALKYLKSVVADFPQSQEAKSAKEEIEKLTGKPAAHKPPAKRRRAKKG